MEARQAVGACALAAVPGVGPRALRMLAEQFGSFAAALDAGAAGILARADVLLLDEAAREYLGQDPDLEQLGLWALGESRRAGAEVVLATDAGYPSLLLATGDAPPVLYVRGSLAAAAKRVAVVGSRDVDRPGADLARRMAEDLARAGVEVISGGARGIDSAAHAGSLWEGGSTVAVLGCGIDQAYPPENRDLFERIASGGGAVVSEFTPGTRPVRANFPRRNRTIAGLSHATVVVRAAPGSGALGTAKHAAARGRALFAVRGDAGDPLCSGPNSLLESGRALAAGSAGEILAQLGWERPPPNPNRDAAHQCQAEIPAGLDASARSVWGVLDARTSIHVDEVAARAHVPAREALRKLTELELLGLCVQKPGKHFQRC